MRRTNKSSGHQRKPGNSESAMIHQSTTGSSLLDRRQFLMVAGGGIVSLSALGLSGCGGFFAGGSSIGGGGTPATGTTALVTFVLPPGVSAANLRCATGWGSVLGLTKPATIPIMQGNVTVAYVIDSTNGKVVMVGMLDDSGSTHTFDSTNVAGALIFLKMGGIQSPTSIRSNLWRLILLDPATTILASVVQARLVADPYAIENHDAQLLTAIQSAVSSLLKSTIDGLGVNPPQSAAHSAIAKPQTSERRQSPTAPVSPGVAMGAIQLISGEKYVEWDLLFPDFVFQLNMSLREVTGYLYEYSHKDSAGVETKLTPIKLFKGPSRYSANNAGGGIIPGDNYTIPLANPTDKVRGFQLITLAPVFDSPVEAPDPIYASFVDQWKAEIVPLYIHTAVQVALFSFLEALGRGGMQLQRDPIESATQQFSAISGTAASAIAAAGKGQDLVGTVNTIISATLASDSAANQVLAIMNRFFGIKVNEVNLALLKATYGISNWINTFGYPGSYMVYSCINSAFHSTNSSVSLSTVDSGRVRYFIEAASNAFTVDGPMVKLSLHDGEYQYQNDFLKPYRKYRWKLTGAGGGRLYDGAAQAGRDIETDTVDISFVPREDVTGDQTITCTVMNLEYKAPVAVSTATIVLKPTLLQLLPTAPILDPGAQQIFTLQHTNFSGFDSGTTFKWTLVGTGSIGGNSPVTTTTPNISYTAPNTPNQDSLTVEVFDAGGTSHGKIAVTITVAVPSRITPHNPYVKHSGTQVFIVAPIAGNYPTGSTFTWSLTGNGSIGGSNPVTTTQPQITYTGPATDSTDNLLVTVKDSSGKTVATTGTVITCSNTQVITANMHWYITSTYPEGVGRTAGEFYGLAIFTALPGAKKYELRISGPDGNGHTVVGTLTAAQLTAGAPVWDPTQTLYQNPNPANYPVPYGGKTDPTVPTEVGFYNAGGGIAWYYDGGNVSSTDANFATAFATILGQQQTPASQDTFSITATF